MKKGNREIAEFLETAAARRLLETLADGNTHSDAALAEVMGCHAEGVSGALALLRRAGLGLVEEAPRQVRLPGGLELLRADRVVEACGTSAEHLGAVQLSLGLASTNDALLDQARAGAASGAVCLAEWQGAGRGRQSRRWISPLACSIYLSLLWRFKSGPPEPCLGLIIGVGVARCLSALGLGELSLKWPNDLRWRQRKLGGILIDGGRSVSGSDYVVTGIGLNYRLPAHVQDHIDQPVATFVEAVRSACPSRNELAGKLLGVLASTLAAIDKGEHLVWRRHWETYDCTRDRTITASLPGGKAICGVGAGLRNDGALLLDDGKSIHPILAGDVSLRVLR